MQSPEGWTPVLIVEEWIAIAETLIGAIALASFLFGISRFLVPKEENITEFSTKMFSHH
jgi:glucose uptake protein GlcU